MKPDRQDEAPLRRVRRFPLVLILGVGALFLWVLFRMWTPQEPLAATGSSRDTRDLGEVLRRSLEQGHSLRIGEDELNAWLAATVEFRQDSSFGGLVRAEEVRVRCHDGYAEIIIGRRVAGLRHTVSLFVSVGQLADGGKELRLDGGRFHAALSRPLRGGRFGSLVVPQGFLHFTGPVYARLADACSAELRSGFERMALIRIESGAFVLEPPPPMATGEEIGEF